MELSPLIFLIIYFIGIVVFLIAGILNFMYILRYGHLTAVSLMISAAFFVVSAGLMLGTVYQLREIDWSDPYVISIPFIDSADNVNVE